MDDIADCQEDSNVSFKRPTIGLLKGSRISSTFSAFSYKYCKESDEIKEIPLETLNGDDDDDEEEAFHEALEKNGHDSQLGKHSESYSSIISPKGSPNKENFSKLGARSSSLDNGSNAIDSSLDTWSNIVNEFKGKWTKKVESKISDLTSRKSPFFTKSKVSDPEKSEISEKDTLEGENVATCKKDDLQIELAEEVSEDLKDNESSLEPPIILDPLSKIDCDRRLSSDSISHENLSGKVTLMENHLSKSSITKKSVEKPASIYSTSYSFILMSVIMVFICGIVYFDVFALAIAFSCGAAFVSILILCMYINHWGIFRILTPGRPNFVPTSKPKFWTKQDVESFLDSSIPHYQGWMNELVGTYSYQSYHEGSLVSAYLYLNGKELQVLYPRNNIPKKARWSDTAHEDIAEWGTFKVYDLSGAVVKLEPEKLKKSRLWRKRYPIVIYLDSDKLNTSVIETPSFLRRRKSSADKNPKKPRLDMVSQGIEDDDFEILSESMGKDGPLYFFARCDREKEDWYRNFYFASRIINYEETVDVDKKYENKEVFVANENVSKKVFVRSPEDINFHKDYILYMSQCLSSQGQERLSITPTSTKYPLSKTDFESQWIVALIGRMFFDFLREPYWAEKISAKIQAKLLKLNIPSFIESLQIKELKLGSAVPVLHSVHSTHFDERGLWIDINISYDGGFRMVLETKINLMKVTDKDYEYLDNYNEDLEIDGVDYADKKSDASPTKSSANTPLQKGINSVDIDDKSDSEESSLSTDSEDEAMGCVFDAQATDSSKKKIIRVVDQITSSTYFRKVAQTSLIKRGMEKVSNTPICLFVELKYLTGCLVVNIPPPPSDRIWLGFRTPPDVWVVAKPKFGDKDIGISHVITFIERKLKSEFEKVTVLPNMVDVLLRFMSGFPKQPDWCPKPFVAIHAADV